VFRKGRLTTAEHSEKGALKGGVYLQYFAAMGFVKVALLVAALFGGQVAWIMSEWWLAKWASSSPEAQQRDMGTWIGVYAGIVACTDPFVLLVLFWVSIRLVQLIHDVQQR
jgi:hypothetical protein